MRYDAYLARGRQTHGARFDPSDLRQEFIPYYNSQERIEVRFRSGEVRRGTVGATTGWRPCFLLLLRANSTGSSWLLMDGDKVLGPCPIGTKRSVPC